MINKIKLERLNSLILRDITQILKKEYSLDPILSKMIIHNVDTTNELSISTVYYSFLLNEINPFSEEVKLKIEENLSNIRYKLAHKLNAFKVPKLVFKFDENLQKANKIEDILKKIKSEKK